MTKERRYLLELSMLDGADIKEIESLLQDVLVELYEQEHVDTVHVTKNGPPDTEDVNELVKIVDSVKTQHVRRAIDSVKELEGTHDDG